VKTFIALLLPATLYAAEPAELEYKTHFLFTWTSSCVQRILPDYQRQGMPYLFAVSMASQGCSCVIDKFRENYTHNELLSLSDEEREERSLYFAQVCGGVTKEM
jgi:hypothetical protein